MANSYSGGFLRDPAGRLIVSGGAQPLGYPEPVLPSVSTLLSSFQTAYAVSSGTGALTLLDTSTPGYWQAGALRVVTPTDASITNVRNTVAPAWNLTGKQLRVLVYCSDVANTTDFKLYLGSDVLNTYTNFGFIELVGSSSVYRPIRSGEWAWISFNLTDLTITGAPAWTAVNNVQLRFTATNGNAVTCKVAALVAVPQPPVGVVSVCFDDLFATTDTQARPILDQYGIPVTGYTIRDLIDTNAAAYLSLATMQRLRDTHLWEFCAHADTVANHNLGFNTLSDTILEREIVGIRSWLRENGFGSGSDHFALPLGAWNPSQEALYRKHFRSLRTIAGMVYGAPETWPPMSPMRVRAQSINETTATATVTGWIDKAVSGKEWIVLVYHDVQPGTPAGGLQIGTAKFSAQMAYIQGLVAGGTLVARTVPDQFRQPAP